jgi:PAS domain S-box-containing protein
MSVAPRPASDALRRSESRYRRLFETARDGILLLNADTAQIEDVNPYLVELLGYSHTKFLGKKLWEVGAFADIAESKEMFAILQEQGYVRYQTLPLKTATGTKIDVEIVANSYDCEGIKVIQCNIRDMTAHAAADLVLREFKTIVDASDDAIISKSLAGSIRSWNPGAARLFGYTAAEAIGQTMAIIIPPDRPDEEAQILARLGRGERVEHFETVRRHKDGHLIDISATISPLFDHNNVLVGASKIARDISETKRAEASRLSLEAQLRESQKMEAIGTLAGGIAHDFNNIIATILGNADLALEDLKGNASANRSVEEIRKAARRARDLVQQILSFSRRQPMERKRISLIPVVEESVRLMRATFPARVHIESSFDPAVPDVMADATQIEQALLNLATNSMQAAGGNSQRISIRLDTVILQGSFADQTPDLRAMHLSRPALTVRMTVSDAGPGMPEATLARIFEPFFTTKPMGEGTGLGLSVVRGIVRAHEGAIVVASESGKGTTFTIYLAVATSPAAHGSPKAKAIASPATHHGLRVLYIDDDDSLVMLIERLLERRHFVVTGFTDAQLAIDRLRKDPTAFDLVVSDYNMPYLSGLDVARAVREIRADLPVAVASGFIDERLLAQAKEAGIRELIVKAVDVAEFCEAVERLAGGMGHPQPPRVA